MSVVGTPQEQNVEIPRGDDRIIRVTLEENGSIENWSFTFAVRVSRYESDDTNPVIERSDGIAISTTGDADNPGVIDITVTDTETLSLARRDYWWSLKRSDDGFETTLVQGTLSMTNTAAR